VEPKIIKESLNMYKIAICDDNKYSLLEAQSMLFKVLDDLREKDSLVDCYNDAQSMLDSKVNYHIFILDIEMPEMNGLVLADKIRKRDPLVIIIFLTNYERYMKESFLVEPFRYLKKPINAEELKEAISGAINKIKPIIITIKDSNGESHVMNIRGIKYLKSEENYCRLYSVEKEETFLIRSALASWEEKLPRNFIRVRRDSIVNLQFIEKLNSNEEIQLSTGEIIKFSRNKKKYIFKALDDYVLLNFRGK
jgi:DNA-binding LytR/AlgR family response regulator